MGVVGYVTFDGTIGDAIEAVGHNIADSNSAHFEQGIGNWVAFQRATTPTNVVSTAPYFGNKALYWEATITGQSSSIKIDNITCGALIRYMSELVIRTPVACDVKLTLFDDDNDLDISTIAIDSQDWKQVAIFGITSAVPIAIGLVIEVGINGELTVNDGIYIKQFSFHRGDTVDQPYRPSMNVVGTLDEFKDPSGLQIDYLSTISSAGDAGYLRVGDGWTGDGYRYKRMDGTNGPIVADFNPSDPAQDEGFLGDRTPNAP